MEEHLSSRASISVNVKRNVSGSVLRGLYFKFGLESILLTLSQQTKVMGNLTRKKTTNWMKVPFKVLE